MHHILILMVMVMVIFGDVLQLQITGHMQIGCGLLVLAMLLIHTQHVEHVQMFMDVWI